MRKNVDLKVRLSRQQTLEYARKHMVSSGGADLDDMDDVAQNDLDLLLANLESFVREPRHLDIYPIAQKIVITDQQAEFAKRAPQRAEGNSGKSKFFEKVYQNFNPRQ